MYCESYLPFTHGHYCPNFVNEITPFNIIHIFEIIIFLKISFTSKYLVKSHLITNILSNPTKLLKSCTVSFNCCVKIN